MVTVIFYLCYEYAGHIICCCYEYLVSQLLIVAHKLSYKNLSLLTKQCNSELIRSYHSTQRIQKPASVPNYEPVQGNSHFHDPFTCKLFISLFTFRQKQNVASKVHHMRGCVYLHFNLRSLLLVFTNIL
jgi:hypothetical protein